MTLTKKKGVWYASFMTATGKRTSKSTKTTNKDDAKRVVKESKIAEIEQAAKTGRITNEVLGQILAGKKITIEQTVTEWVAWMRSISMADNTIRNHVASMGAWMEHAGVAKTPPSTINEGHITAFVNDPKQDWKATTRQAHLAAIRGYFNFAAAKGWVLGNPSRLTRVNYSILKHDQKEKREGSVFSDSDWRKLLAYLQKRMAEAERESDEASKESTKYTKGTARYEKAVARADRLAKDARNTLFWIIASTIARHTGLRLIDIVSLEWSSLSKPGAIAVWTVKRDKRVFLPLQPRELEQAIASIPLADRVYCFPEERELYLGVDTRPHFSVKFSRLLDAAGLVGKTFHDLRHTYITECVMQGIPIEHIAVNVGHSSIATTKIYVHKTEDGE